MINLLIFFKVKSNYFCELVENCTIFSSARIVSILLFCVEDDGNDFGSNASSPAASENDEDDQKVMLSPTKPG